MLIFNILRKNFSNFCKNESGNIFITTVISAPLLLIAVGVGVDTAEIYRNRVNFQNATDAGTLYATKVFAATADKNKAEKAGRRVFHANMGNTTETFKEFNIVNTAPDCAGGKIIGTGAMRHPIFFAHIYEYFGSNSTNKSGEVTLHAVTEVTCSISSLELAMVLDVSNSMNGTPKGSFETKIESLETAATSLVTKLHAAFLEHPNKDALKIAVVPFAGMVNIGKQHKTADWMDTLGQASYHHEDLGWSPDRGQNQLSDGGWEDQETKKRLTRFTLFDELGEDWAGCVLHRPHPYNVTDEAPSSSDPETLFVPAFAPDTPDKLNGNHWTGNKGESTKKDGEKIIIHDEERYSNNYLYDFHNSPYDLSINNTGLNQAQRLEWPFKYFKDKNGVAPEIRNGVDKKEKMGPNHYCVTQPIVPLTSHEKTVTDTVGEMSMGFGTEIHQGILWGWRALSPGAPFQEGQKYNKAANKKVMIVMTDGANYVGDSITGNRSAVPGSQYFAHGFTRNNRIWAGTGFPTSTPDNKIQFTRAMNELQKQTCDNAKADGITIYAIAFDIKDDTDRSEVMEYCASRGVAGELLYMTAEDGDELVAAFERVASDLGNITMVK